MPNCEKCGIDMLLAPGSIADFYCPICSVTNKMSVTVQETIGASVRDYSCVLCECQEAKHVLKPLVDIADAYDENALDDEARKIWGKNDEHYNTTPSDDIILYSGRGGKTLLTLGDCLRAREVYNRKERL